MLTSAEIVKKIKSFHTIKDIVSAMKVYAGVNIKKTEELVTNIRVYEENILSAIADIMAHHIDISLEMQHGKRVLVAFGSSQGLCGPFNEKIADAISHTMREGDALFITGKRLKSSLEIKHLAYDGYTDSVTTVNGIQMALKEIVPEIMNIYKKEEYYTLTLIFTYIIGNQARMSIEQILPPDISRISVLQPSRIPPFTYIDPKIMFDMFLEEFLYISLYRGYLESLRSENWYRLRSMDAANESLKRHLSELTSMQNYARQEETTEEMLEILRSGMFYGKNKALFP